MTRDGSVVAPQCGSDASSWSVVAPKCGAR
jgi:hypothetical protein